jgi:hypothetical protein
LPTDSRVPIFMGFFVQDSWKVKPNLTLTLGLRREYFGPLSEKNGNLSTLELGNSQQNALTGLCFRKGGNLYNAQAANFGPQIVFAWSPNSVFHHDVASRLVIRGGFGSGYTGEGEAITLNGSSNPPFLSFAGTLTGPQILYQAASTIHWFNCYPANPNTLTAFNGNNVPVSGAPIGGTGFPANFPTPYSGPRYIDVDATISKSFGLRLQSLQQSQRESDADGRHHHGSVLWLGEAGLGLSHHRVAGALQLLTLSGGVSDGASAHAQKKAANEPPFTSTRWQFFFYTISRALLFIFPPSLRAPDLSASPAFRHFIRRAAAVGCTVSEAFSEFRLAGQAGCRRPAIPINWITRPPFTSRLSRSVRNGPKVGGRSARWSMTATITLPPLEPSSACLFWPRRMARRTPC